MSTPPAPSPAPAGKSNLLWWILGLLVVGIVILGAGGLLVLSRLAKNVRVEEAGNTVEIETPVGTLQASDEPASTGLPEYPGAAPSDQGGSVELEGPEETALSIRAARFSTIDPIAKVDAWYTERLGPAFVREGPGVFRKKKDIVGAEVSSDDIAFVREAQDHLSVVALKKKPNGTDIVLLRIGKNEPQ